MPFKWPLKFHDLSICIFYSMCSWIFSKISKNAENELFWKNHKKSFISKNLGVLVFFKLARPVWNYLYFNSKQNCTQTLIFLKKCLLHFWTQKFLKCYKTLPKHHLTVVHWNAHIWAKIHFNIISAESEKKEIEKWPLITSFHCTGNIHRKAYLILHHSQFYMPS